MKYFIILLSLLSSLFAEKITIGAGPYFQTQPYKNADMLVLPSPVFFYDNGIVYLRWTRAGMYFLGEKKEDYSWGFSLTIQPRPYGYEASDSKDLKGMDQRKDSFEGGLAFVAKADKAYVEVMLLNDILNSTDGWIVSNEIGYKFEAAGFSFYPSLIAVYQSSNFTNYYYGVKQNEVTSNRALYTPDAGFQFGMQTYIARPVSENFSLFANIKADRLSQEAANSPIVDKEYMFSGILSLIYTIEY